MKTMACAAIFLAAFLAIPTAWARPPHDLEAALPPAAVLQQLVAQAESMANLPEEQKAVLLEDLRSALAFAEEAAKEEAATETLQELTLNVEKTLAELRETQRELLVPPAPDEVPRSAAELESWIPGRQYELNRANRLRIEAEQELARLRDWPPKGQAEIDAAHERLARLQTPGLAPRGDWNPGDAPALRQAWEREALLRRGQRLEVELGTLDSRMQIANEQSRTAALQADRLQPQLDAAREQLAKLRDAQILGTSSSARDRQREMKDAPPLLRELAEQNVRHAEALETDAADANALGKELSQRQADLQRVRLSLDWVNEILSIGNLPVAYSDQLRQERQKLLWLRQVEPQARKRQERAAVKRLAEIEVREAFRALAEEEARVSAKPAGAEPLSRKDRAAAQELLQTQRQLLEGRERVLNEYQRVLGLLNLAEVQILRDGGELARILDGRLIWTRSLQAMGPRWLREQRLHAPRLVSEKERYFGSPSERWDVFRESQAEWVAGLLVLAGALRVAPRMRRRIQSLAERTNRPLTDRFFYTVGVLFWTLVLAGIGPAAMLYFGWLLKQAPAGQLIQGAGHGLMGAAWVWWACSFARGLCRPQGLGDVHFLWPETTRLRLLKAAGTWRWVFTPLIALVLLFHWNGEEWLRGGPERIAFLALLAALAWSVHQTLRADGGIFHDWLTGASPFARRLMQVAHVLGISLLAVLIVAVVRGYFYTAQVILLHLAYIAGVLLTAVLVFNLALRWMRVARRRYAVAQVRARRKESRTAEAEPLEGESAGIQLQDLEPDDINTLDDQTRRLIRLAVVVTTALVLLNLFRPLLPALGIFDSVELWTREDGQVITLRSLLIAVLAAFLTIGAARNIPGVLEMTLLPLVHMKNSSRFAVATLARYAITLTGIVFAFGAIGIGWSQVQWLAAAITVGLGFGLQEIFANFVSGLILLFEQPIRVGDVITIDQTTGVVSRIQMRATTITDWDRKELIVPNKELVTGRLLNWTLSDNVNRVMVNVGIAYGADVRRALDLMLEVAARSPTVLKDPKPVVSFEAFGESSLSLSLRAYLSGMDNRLPTLTELHSGIYDAFRQAGIGIAFPQRDLHLRSIDPEAAEVLRAPSHTPPSVSS